MDGNFGDPEESSPRILSIAFSASVVHAELLIEYPLERANPLMTEPSFGFAEYAEKYVDPFPLLVLECDRSNCCLRRGSTKCPRRLRTRRNSKYFTVTSYIGVVHAISRPRLFVSWC